MRKGQKQTEESKAKISAKWSPERKLEMSERKKKMWEEIKANERRIRDFEISRSDFPTAEGEVK